ncbi:hypothetical protein RintRC_4812 [Richelia intracellularis]|nr:hypothetical protein RintRC_4812 [Richelia intracellularis]
MKQFILDLMWSGDGDIPLYLRVAHGNEVDSAMFGTLLADFHKQWQIDALLYPKKLQLPLPQNRLAGLLLPPMFLIPTNLATKMFYLNIRQNNLQNVVFGFSKTHCFLLQLCL